MLRVSLERKVVLAFTAALLVILSFSIVGFRSTTVVAQGASDVERTNEVVGAVDALLSEVTRLETATRGFVLTGDPVFLSSYERAAPNTLQQLEEVALLLDGRYQEEFGALQGLVRSRVDQAGELVTARQTGGLRLAQDVIRRGGRELYEELRQLTAQIQRVELNQLAQRHEERARNTRTTQLSLVLGALASALFMSIAIVVLRRELQRREQFQNALARSASELSRAEERFRGVVESSPSAVLMVDERGQITLVNRECERLFGYEREELLGKSINMLVPQQYGGRHQALIDTFVRIPAERRIGSGPDLLARTKSGADVPVEIGLNPIRIDERTFVLATVLDVTERKQHEERIQQSLAEKDMLLREIHHRVKNNMQVVSSILALQSSVVESAEARLMLDDCQSRVRSMAMVHEKLYRSHNLASIDFSQYVEDLAQTILRSFGQLSERVRLAIDADPEAIDIDAAIPLGLIANELITNALKYAFPGERSGTVRLQFCSAGPDRLLLSVGDDGVGFASGTARAPTSSLGLRLVRSLTRQLKGQLEIRDAHGVEFRITFPKRRRTAKKSESLEETV